MAVHFLGKTGERSPSFSQRLGAGVKTGLDFASQHQEKEEQKQAFKKLGLDPASLKLPQEGQKEYFKREFGKEENQSKKFASEQQDLQRYNTIKKNFGENAAELYRSAPEGGKTELLGRFLEARERGMDIEQLLGSEEQENPSMNAEDIISEKPKKNKSKDFGLLPKEVLKRDQELRKETLPFRSDLAKKAQAASKGISNKNELLHLIKEGKIDDPTYAALAEALPLNLGKRLLSPETVTYKAGLIEEFSDLRNIFEGQTKIKEIDLLENKIADLYLTDEQKESILNSRLRALRADIIRAEAAEQIENEPLGVLQFQKKVEEIAKPKLEALFNSILDEQKSIIQNAENKKKIPLDMNDPDDMKIATAIIQEAGGNRNKAREIAKKKGYSF